MAALTAEEGVKLLMDDDLSDFTIDCEGYEFEVHKAILAAASPFFASRIKKDFLVCTSPVEYQQAKKNKMKFPFVDPVAMASVIRYMYTDELDVLYLRNIWTRFDESTDQEDHLTEICSLVRVYVLADRLQMDLLRAIACNSIVEWSPESDNAGISGWLPDLLTDVYQLTPRDDPIRTNITARGMRSYLQLDADGDIEEATKILNIMRAYEPVATGVALQLLVEGRHISS